MDSDPDTSLSPVGKISQTDQSFLYDKALKEGKVLPIRDDSESDEKDDEGTSSFSESTSSRGNDTNKPSQTELSFLLEKHLRMKKNKYKHAQQVESLVSEEFEESDDAMQRNVLKSDKINYPTQFRREGPSAEKVFRDESKTEDDWIESEEPKSRKSSTESDESKPSCKCQQKSSTETGESRSSSAYRKKTSTESDESKPSCKCRQKSATETEESRSSSTYRKKTSTEFEESSKPSSTKCRPKSSTESEESKSSCKCRQKSSTESEESKSSCQCRPKSSTESDETDLICNCRKKSSTESEESESKSRKKSSTETELSESEDYEFRSKDETTSSKKQTESGSKTEDDFSLVSCKCSKCQNQQRTTSSDEVSKSKCIMNISTETEPDESTSRDEQICSCSIEPKAEQSSFETSDSDGRYELHPCKGSKSIDSKMPCVEKKGKVQSFTCIEGEQNEEPAICKREFKEQKNTDRLSCLRSKQKAKEEFTCLKDVVVAPDSSKTSSAPKKEILKHICPGPSRPECKSSQLSCTHKKMKNPAWSDRDIVILSEKDIKIRGYKFDDEKDFYKTSWQTSSDDRTLTESVPRSDVAKGTSSVGSARFSIKKVFIDPKHSEEEFFSCESESETKLCKWKSNKKRGKSSVSIMDDQSMKSIKSCGTCYFSVRKDGTSSKQTIKSEKSFKSVKSSGSCVTTEKRARILESKRNECRIDQGKGEPCIQPKSIGKSEGELGEKSDFVCAKGGLRTEAPCPHRSIKQHVNEGQSGDYGQKDRNEDVKTTFGSVCKSKMSKEAVGKRTREVCGRGKGDKALKSTCTVCGSRMSQKSVSIKPSDDYEHDSGEPLGEPSSVFESKTSNQTESEATSGNLEQVGEEEDVSKVLAEDGEQDGEEEAVSKESAEDGELDEEKTASKIPVADGQEDNIDDEEDEEEEETAADGSANGDGEEQLKGPCGICSSKISKQTVYKEPCGSSERTHEDISRIGPCGICRSKSPKQTVSSDKEEDEVEPSNIPRGICGSKTSKRTAYKELSGSSSSKYLEVVCGSKYKKTVYREPCKRKNERKEQSLSPCGICGNQTSTQIEEEDVDEPLIGPCGICSSKMSKQVPSKRLSYDRKREEEKPIIGPCGICRSQNSKRQSAIEEEDVEEPTIGPCGICGIKEFPTTVSKHPDYEGEQDEDKPIIGPCGICKSQTSKRTFSKRLSTIEEEDVEKLSIGPCGICGSKASRTTVSKNRGYDREQHEDKPIIGPCGICGSQTSKSTFKKPLSGIEEEEDVENSTIGPCGICSSKASKTTSSKLSSYDRGQEEEEEEEETHSSKRSVSKRPIDYEDDAEVPLIGPCGICGSNTSKKTVSKHLSYYGGENEEEPLIGPCGICGSKISKQEFNKGHSYDNVDENEEPLVGPCGICESHVSKRIVSKRPSDFCDDAEGPITGPCGICGSNISKKTTSKGVSRQKISSKEEPLSIGPCGICGRKSFKRSVNKKTCQQKEEDEKSLIGPCGICGSKQSKETIFKEPCGSSERRDYGEDSSIGPCDICGIKASKVTVYKEICGSSQKTDEIDEPEIGPCGICRIKTSKETGSRGGGEISDINVIIGPCGVCQVEVNDVPCDVCERELPCEEESFSEKFSNICECIEEYFEENGEEVEEEELFRSCYCSTQTLTCRDDPYSTCYTPAVRKENIMRLLNDLTDIANCSTTFAEDRPIIIQNLFKEMTMLLTNDVCKKNERQSASDTRRVCKFTPKNKQSEQMQKCLAKMQDYIEECFLKDFPKPLQLPKKHLYRVEPNPNFDPSLIYKPTKKLVPEPYEEEASGFIEETANADVELEVERGEEYIPEASLSDECKYWLERSAQEESFYGDTQPCCTEMFMTEDCYCKHMNISKRVSMQEEYLPEDSDIFYGDCDDCVSAPEETLLTEFSGKVEELREEEAEGEIEEIIFKEELCIEEISKDENICAHLCKQYIKKICPSSCNCCHCRAMRNEKMCRPASRAINAAMIDPACEMKYFIDSIIFDLDAMDQVLHDRDCKPKKDKKANAIARSIDSYPVKILDITDLGLTSLYVSWEIYDCCGIAGYEIYVDGHLTNRFYSPCHTSGVICDVNINRRHQIVLRAHPLGEDFPGDIYINPNMDKKRQSLDRGPGSQKRWSPSVFFYDPC